MSDLRLVTFASDYWHVMSDKHASIIGNLMRLETPPLPWRAEFSGTMADGWKHQKVGYFRTEEEAMIFLRDALEDEEALDE